MTDRECAIRLVCGAGGGLIGVLLGLGFAFLVGPLL